MMYLYHEKNCMYNRLQLNRTLINRRVIYANKIRNYEDRS